MLQVVGNRMIKQPKVNFGSQNIAPPSLGAINPAPISNDPYEERHGYIKNDLYGLKSNNADMKPLLTRPAMDLYPKATDMHDGYQSRTPSSILKPILTLAAIGGGITLAIVKRKSIAKLFKKTPKSIEASDIKSMSKFNEFHTNVQNKIANDQIAEVKLPKEIKILLDGKTADERKEALTKAYQLAEVSAKNEIQPKLRILLPEELSSKTKNIIDKIKHGKIDNIDIADIEKIDGFKLTKTGYTHPEIAVEGQVRRGVNTDSFSDKGKSLIERTKEAIRHP